MSYSFFIQPLPPPSFPSSFSAAAAVVTSRLACAAVAGVRDGQAAANVGEDRAHQRLLVGVLQHQLRDCGARRVHAVLGEAGVGVLEGGHCK